MISYQTKFAEIGRAVYFSNALISLQNTLYLAPEFGMGNDFQTVWGYDMFLIPGFLQTVLGFSSQMASQVTALTQTTNAVLGSMQLDLNSPSTTPNVILPLLYRQMVIDGQSVLHNVIAAPVITPGAGNNGNGVMYASTINALGLTDERSLTQTVQFICTSSQWNGGTAGAETFTTEGWPQLPTPGTYGIPGNGSGPILRVSDSNNLINNGDFSSFPTPAYVPTNWTLSAGTANTNCRQTTAVFLNAASPSALELLGDGATAAITLTQVIASNVSSQTVYAASVFLRKGGTVPGGSTITVNITGTGAATQTLLSVDASTLTTSFVEYHLFYATAATVPPSNYSVNISWTGTPGGSAIVYVANYVLCAPVNYGSVNYVLFRGSTDFAAGDSFQSSTVLTSAGVFQEYFCRQYNFALPSSGSPTISDALALNLS